MRNSGNGVGALEQVSGLLKQRITSAVLLLVVVSSVLIAGWDHPEELSSAAFLAIASATAILVWLPGLACLAAIGGEPGSSLSAVTVLIGAGANALLLLGAWFISPTAGATFTWCSVGLSTLFVCLRPERLLRLRMPLLLMFATAILYAAIVGDHGQMSTAVDTVAIRYWVAPDNKIPTLLMDGLMQGRDSLIPFLGDWLASDRPPLMSGMLAVVYPLAADNGKLAVAQSAGVASNLYWIVAVWAFLRALKLSDARTGFIIVCLVLSGAIYLNTVYTWPKILAGAFCLAAAAMMVDASARRAGQWAPGIGVCAGLSMLTHGAIAFGLIGLAPLVWIRRAEWKWRELAVAGLTAFAVYSPWAAYQKFFDPPGDRLAKWHLAGVIDITDEDTMSTIVESYAQAGLDGTLENKLRNVRVFLGVEGADSSTDLSWNDTLTGAIRYRSITAIGVSGMLAPLGLLLFGWSCRREYWFRPMVATIACSSATFLLMAFGDPTYQSAAWLHHAPYSLVLMWPALGFLSATRNKTFSLALLVATMLVFIFLWIIDARQAQWRPADLGDFRPSMVIVEAIVIGALVAFGAFCVRKFSATESTGPTPASPDSEVANAPAAKHSSE